MKRKLKESRFKLQENKTRSSLSFVVEEITKPQKNINTHKSGLF